MDLIQSEIDSKTSIVVCIQEITSQAAMLIEILQKKLNGKVDIFTVFDNVCKSRDISDNDELARKMHEDYCWTKAPDHPKNIAWEKLAEDDRESNRNLAEHLSVKKRAIQRLCGGRLPPALPEDVLEKLAEMEHRRWSAEKRLAGYICGQVKDVQEKLRRVNALLQDWEQLDDAAKNYNREAIRRMYKRIMETEGNFHGS